MKKGKVDALLGIVFGDEGKGKVVDVFTPEYDVVARFAGGPNAGHTIIFEGQKFVLRSIPSGIFAKDKVNIIGNGCVIAPDLFMAEAKELEAAGYDLKERLHISKRAHLILPTHRVLDRAYEAAKGKAKVGTTGKGIGPTYSDKAARIGLRVGDILDRFEEKYAALKARHEQILKDLHYTDYDITDEEKLWLEGVEYLRGFHLTDTEIEINRYLKEGKNVLAEGAQGTMLDIDHGTYPFVSSSNTTSGGVCTGLGVGPTDIREVFGIFKAYSTRVGSGPFPVELFDETGDTLREVGHEYGAVTGRIHAQCGNRTAYRAEPLLPTALRLAESVRMDSLGRRDVPAMRLPDSGTPVHAGTPSQRTLGRRVSRPSPHGPARFPPRAPRRRLGLTEIPDTGRSGTRGRGKDSPGNRNLNFPQK